MNADGGVERLFRNISPQVARILDRALEGHDITVEDMVLLLSTRGPDARGVWAVADELRRQRVGDVVTYVVNRNINFTNVCIKQCGFCAFSRGYREEEAYFLPPEEVVRRAREAWELGATEVCIQAGLPPKMDGDLYIRLTEAIKAELPDIHIHGFSPEEVLYGAVRSRRSIRDYLQALKDAGVGSLPGTSAEILVQEVRDRISPGRITVERWVEVITTAHRLGIPTTSTIMYGHVESMHHRALHLKLVRDIQKATGGFTEFVPLSFVSAEAPMFRHQTVTGLRPGPTGIDVFNMHAVARIALNNWIPNIQVSWVKEGLRMAQVLLETGANDLGGTLINESISTSAGAGFGQMVKPAELRALAFDSGRPVAERTTLYQIRRRFNPGEEYSPDPLDGLTESADQRFGSYFDLIRSGRYPFRHPQEAAETAARSASSSTSRVIPGAS